MIELGDVVYRNGSHNFILTVAKVRTTVSADSTLVEFCSAEYGFWNNAEDWRVIGKVDQEEEPTTHFRPGDRVTFRNVPEELKGNGFVIGAVSRGYAQFRNPPMDYGEWYSFGELKLVRESP